MALSYNPGYKGVFLPVSRANCSTYRCFVVFVEGGEFHDFLLCHFDLTDPPWPTPLAILKDSGVLCCWGSMEFRLKTTFLSSLQFHVMLCQSACLQHPVLPCTSSPLTCTYIPGTRMTHIYSGQAFMVKICSWYKICAGFVHQKHSWELLLNTKPQAKWNPKRTTH